MNLGTLALRYRPVALAVTAAVGVIQLVPPLDRTPAVAPSIAPFTGAPPAAATASRPLLPAAAAGVAAAPGGADLVVAGDHGGAEPPPLPLPSRPIADEVDPSIVASLPAAGRGAIAVTPDGSVLATLEDQGGSGALAVLAPDGTTSTILVPGVGDLTAVAVVGGGHALLASGRPAAVLEVELATGAASVPIAIPDVPTCIPVVRERDCDGSTSDAPPRPVALAVDAGGNVFVADAGQAAIWRIAPGSETSVEWLVDGAFAAADAAGGLAGIAFDGAGNLVILAGSVPSTTSGALYIQTIGPDGGPGTRRRLALLTSRPSGLVLGITGSVFVPLPDLGALLVLSGQGSETERRRLDALAGVGDLHGVAFRARSVLVATPTSVIAVPVGELGGRGPGAGS